MVAKIVLLVLLGSALALASPISKDDKHDSTSAVVEAAIDEVGAKDSQEIVVFDVTDQPLETVTPKRKWYKKYILDKIPFFKNKKVKNFFKKVIHMKPEEFKKYGDKLKKEFQALTSKASKLFDQGKGAYEEVKQIWKMVQKIFEDIKSIAHGKELGDSLEDKKDTPRRSEPEKISDADAKDEEPEA